MENRAAITKPGHAMPIQQMGIDARNLWRDIGAKTHGTTRNLIDQLECAQIQITPSAGEQRIDIFEHRRHDEQIAMHSEQFENARSECLDPLGLWGKDVLDVLRQQPLAQFRDARSPVRMLR